jgi:hypothetical protein
MDQQDRPESVAPQVAKARLEAMAALVRLGQLDPPGLMALLAIRDLPDLKERMGRLALLVTAAQRVPLGQPGQALVIPAPPDQLALTGPKD